MIPLEYLAVPARSCFTFDICSGLGNTCAYCICLREMSGSYSYNEILDTNLCKAVREDNKRYTYHTTIIIHLFEQTS